MIDYNARLKGAITQTLVRSLLEDAGYRVVPLGIEETLREVSILDQQKYLALRLPEALRRLPDFFVSDPEFTQSWPLEVKYLKEWNPSTRNRLGEKLKLQVPSWNPLGLLVFLGKSASPYSEVPATRIGFARIGADSNRDLYVDSKDAFGNLIRWQDATWSNFRRLQDEFKKVGERWADWTITKALEVLDSLSGIDLYD